MWDANLSEPIPFDLIALLEVEILSVFSGVSLNDFVTIFNAPFFDSFNKLGADPLGLVVSMYTHLP
jgi:hypothetical protein